MDPRTKFNGGYLFLKTDRISYYPGNKVIGEIQIRAEAEIRAQHV